MQIILIMRVISSLYFLVQVLGFYNHGSTRLAFAHKFLFLYMSLFISFIIWVFIICPVLVVGDHYFIFVWFGKAIILMPFLNFQLMVSLIEWFDQMGYLSLESLLIVKDFGLIKGQKRQLHWNIDSFILNFSALTFFFLSVLVWHKWRYHK